MIFKMPITKKSLYVFYVTSCLFGYLLISLISEIVFPPELSSPLALLFRAFIFVFSIIYIVGYFNSKNRIEITKNSKWLLIIYLFFWFYYILKLLLYFNDISVTNSMMIHYILFGVCICFIPSISVIREVDDVICDKILILSFFMLFIGVFCALYLSSNMFISGMHIESNRLALSRLSPIQIGKYSAFLAIVSYSILIRFNNKKSVFFIAVFAMFFSLVAVVLSGSRTAILGLIIVFFINMIIQFSLIKVITSVILLPIFGYLSIFIASFVFPNLDILGRYLSMGGKYDQSANIRYQLYDGALEQFSNSPVFGDFFIERVFNYAPHNLIIEILMSLGVIGFLLFFMIILISFFKLKSKMFEHNVAYKLFLMNSFLYLLFASLFSSGITTAPELWMIIIMILNGISIKKDGNVI